MLLVAKAGGAAVVERKSLASRLLLTVVFAIVANNFKIDRLMEKPIRNQGHALIVANAVGWCDGTGRPSTSVRTTPKLESWHGFTMDMRRYNRRLLNATTI
jgi:hypothetical protein